MHCSKYKPVTERDVTSFKGLGHFYKMVVFGKDKSLNMKGKNFAAVIRHLGLSQSHV